LRKGLKKIPGADLADLNIDRNNVITAVVRSTNNITKNQVKLIAANLPLKHGKRPELHMRIVKVQEVLA